jgi:hypothetical protein
MPDREKVIKGFTVCSEHGLLNGEDCHGHYEYTDNLADIIKANDYSKQCPYNGCKTGCVKTLAKDALALLKEQEDFGTELTNAVELIHKKNERIEKLLKEQEAVEPYRVNTHYDQHWKCSHCDSVIGVQDKYCRQCGHALKWK